MLPPDTIKKISQHIDNLAGDTSVPKNVRNALALAKERLKDPDAEAAISGAVYALESVSNDINMPMHARTIIWNLMSELEMLKEQRD
ncbi:MAG TPA: UPF0147 family protein [Candidatus Norongarragalinales archaeon]|jgi:hypothetical protein|nr:UPF0147 family protein [Candidatus Norongarragalinales archaeon]